MRRTRRCGWDCWGAGAGARQWRLRSRRIRRRGWWRWRICLRISWRRGKRILTGINAGLGVPAIDPKLMFRGSHAYEELANSKDVDAVQISTPPWFHVQHLDAVVRAGKHAYCEKPLGVDVAQAEAGAGDRQARGRPAEPGRGLRGAQRAADRRSGAADSCRGHWESGGDYGALLRAECGEPQRDGLVGGRVPAAQLAVGPGALRGHHGGAEHPRDRSGATGSSGATR